jgi:glucose-6-phosphate 1-epimerase
MTEQMTEQMTPQLDVISLSHSSGSRATIHRYGAHVTSWIDATGRERLYLSRRAHFGGGKSIRGGIPIVFPQLADTGPLPNHGFLRTREWDLASLEASTATLVTTDDAATRALWPHRFQAKLHVALNEALAVELSVTNTDRWPFTFTAAFHTYFAVDDIRFANVVGLSGSAYHDKLNVWAFNVEARSFYEALGLTPFNQRMVLELR